jgi:hypothetical protein
VVRKCGCSEPVAVAAGLETGIGTTSNSSRLNSINPAAVHSVYLGEGEYMITGERARNLSASAHPRRDHLKGVRCHPTTPAKRVLVNPGPLYSDAGRGCCASGEGFPSPNCVVREQWFPGRLHECPPFETPGPQPGASGSPIATSCSPPKHPLPQRTRSPESPSGTRPIEDPPRSLASSSAAPPSRMLSDVPSSRTSAPTRRSPVA